MLRSLTTARGWTTRVLSAFLVLWLGASASATPASVSSGLSFTTGTQSLWGPGGSSASFGASGSASIPATFFTPELGVGYAFSASTGTVSASSSGTVGASYDDHLAAPGTTTIGLSYGAGAGSFSTNLGARANLTGFVHDVPFFGPWDFCFYCQNWSLQTSASSITFNTDRVGSDAVSVAGVGPNIVVASALVSLNGTQSSRMHLDAFEGTLEYVNRDTGTTGQTAFAFAGGLRNLVVNLNEPGTWDFSLKNLDLSNTFRTTMGVGLSFDIDVFGIISESFPFANVPLLNVSPFELDFGEKQIANWFSITVPEPGTSLLLAMGCVGLFAVGRTGHVRGR